MLDRLWDPRDVKDRHEICQIYTVINLAVYTYNTSMTEQAHAVLHHLSSSKILRFVRWQCCHQTYVSGSKAQFSL